MSGDVGRPGGLLGLRPEPCGLGHSASIPDAEIRDAIIMEIAGWIEEGDLLSYAGICHRRKREREDAALRVQTSNEVRARLADMLRGRMQNKVGDPIEFLADVKAGRYDRHYSGYDLREAFALADKNLLLIQALTQVAGPWTNVAGGTTAYRITLTDEGEKALAQAIEARSVETEGLDPKDESAVRQDAPSPCEGTPDDK